MTLILDETDFKAIKVFSARLKIIEESVNRNVLVGAVFRARFILLILKNKVYSIINLQYVNILNIKEIN